jgi:acyl dehydratase
MHEAVPAVRLGVHYLEDLAPGQRFVSAGRTITEADVVAFAGLSGDFNVIHTDAEFAKGTVYGQRIVYGLLGLSVATGLLDRLGVFSGSAIAMLGITDWRFTAPVFIGDTVHLELTLVAVRPSRSKPDRGIVERQFELVNQRGEVVQVGRIDVLVRRAPTSDLPCLIRLSSLIAVSGPRRGREVRVHVTL